MASNLGRTLFNGRTAPAESKAPGPGRAGAFDETSLNLDGRKVRGLVYSADHHVPESMVMTDSGPVAKAQTVPGTRAWRGGPAASPSSDHTETLPSSVQSRAPGHAGSAVGSSWMKCLPGVGYGSRCCRVCVMDKIIMDDVREVCGVVGTHWYV